MMTASDISNDLNVCKTDGHKASFWFQFRFQAKLAYSQSGSILRCGSSLLRGRAAAIYNFHVLHPDIQEFMTKQSTTLNISRELMTDLIVRLHLNLQFEDVLGQVLSADVRTRLRHILMNIVYPHVSSEQLAFEEA